MGINNLLRAVGNMNKHNNEPNSLRWDNFSWVYSNDRSTLFIRPIRSEASVNDNGKLEFSITSQVGKETHKIIILSDDSDIITEDFIISFKYCDMTNITILNQSIYGERMNVIINNCVHDDTTVIDDSVKSIEYIDGLTIHQRNMIKYCAENYNLEFRMERHHNEWMTRRDL